MTPAEQKAEKPETVTPVEEPKAEERKPKSEGEAEAVQAAPAATTPTPVDGGDAVTIPKE